MGLIMMLLRTLSIISVFLLFLSCGGPRHVADPIFIEQEVVDSRIETFLKKMETEEHFSGVALVMRKDEVVHAKGYGMANSDRKNSVTIAFHIASITKQFTAAALLQLVEKGIVHLEESINTYLPKEYRSPKWDSVTLHHLLSHTSGITNYEVTRDYYEVVNGFCLGNTVDGMVKEAMGKELEFEPGSKFSYSDINYTLLGFVIENQTQTPYNEYLTTNILDPMGMRDSKIHVIGHVPATEEAEGYRWSNEQSIHVPDDIISLPVTEPDGGLVTTLTDFVKWVGIYLGKDQTILSQNSIAMITSPVIGANLEGPRGKPQSYGYGLLMEDELINHSGYIVGFKSDFILDRKKEILIVVFSNNTTNDPIHISTGLLKILE
jgi:CubicO group peptidase (beta-lactamase class C family)